MEKLCEICRKNKVRKKYCPECRKEAKRRQQYKYYYAVTRRKKIAENKKASND